VAERLFLVDGHSHLFRAYHAVGYLSTSRGVPSHAVLILSTMLWKLIREERPDYLGIAWDAPGATFRDRLFEEYKATRAAMPADLAQQLPYVRRLFEALRTPVVEAPGFEADDVLGTLVARVADRDLEVVIVTGDKDLLQLVSPRVSVLSVVGRSGERVRYDAAKVRERWGVDPAQIPDVLALMGDSIDNIPGVPGVGEKTAVKLLAQFGTVDRLYENLALVAGKLRETLAAHRKQALLSRELATVSRQVPIDFDLEAFRLREPDWPRLRALWMEMEFSRLLKDLPAQTVEVGTEPVAALATEAALRDYLAGVPPGEPVAMDWAGESRPPEPELQGLGLFHPAAGGAFVPLGPETAEAIGRTLGGSRELIVHDAKPVLGWLLARGVAPPAVEDSAVAAYLLNPARQSYPLEQLSLETLGESPPDLAGAAGLGPAELGARLAARARAVWRYWGYAAGQLDALGLRSVYAEIERPLVPVLARMERAGIRVDVERLEGFAKELERSLDLLTREIHQMAGEPFTIGSPKQLAHVLFEKLKLPASRRTKTGYSTDADVLTELAIGHELPAKILEYRTLSKLKSTYADALPGLINPVTGRIHTRFNQLVASTGRLSCLPAGTLVDTQRGLIGIEEVRPGDYVRTALGLREVLAFEATGPKRVVAIHLSSGTVIRCSEDHKLRSSGEWRRARGLQIGDPLYMSFRSGLFGESRSFEVGRTAAYWTRKSPRLPGEWSVELAELVGYMMADGHIARSTYNGKPAKLVLAFGWDEEELQHYFAAIIVKLFGKAPTRRVTRTCPVLEVSGVDICGLLERLGAGGPSRSIRVPSSLFRAPESIVAAFLRGYFEGDGCVTERVSVRSVSRLMLEAVHHLLTMFGIPSVVRKGTPDPRGYAPRYTLFVVGDRSKRAFGERINFISGRKRAQLAQRPSARSSKSGAEIVGIPDPIDLIETRTALYDACRTPAGKVPPAMYVFINKYATGRTTTITLSRAEHVVASLEAGSFDVPSFLEEMVLGQYYEVTVTGVDYEAPAPMYEIMVDGSQYLANGIVVHNSSEPNLQNIPIRTELGRRIRGAFLPEAGWRFVAGDYSQIELRILAHCAGEESIVEAFRQDADIHTRTAAEVLRVPPEAVTDEHRRIAKMINYALLYGISAFGLAQGARIPQAEAERYIREYYATHPRVRAFIERTLAEGREHGYVTTSLGRRRYLPDLTSGNAVARQAAERMAINAPIQGSSADMIKLAMVRVDAALRARGLRSRMLLQVHDELVFECPPDEVPEVTRLARELMESAMPLDVPVRVDVKVGDDWSQV